MADRHVHRVRMIDRDAWLAALAALVASRPEVTGVGVSRLVEAAAEGA